MLRTPILALSHSSGKAKQANQPTGRVVFDPRCDDAHLNADTRHRRPLLRQERVVGGDGEIAWREWMQQFYVIVGVHALARDEEDAVHHPEGGQQIAAIVFRHDWSVRTLPAPHPRV